MVTPLRLYSWQGVAFGGGQKGGKENFDTSNPKLIWSDGQRGRDRPIHDKELRGCRELTSFQVKKSIYLCKKVRFSLKIMTFCSFLGLEDVGITPAMFSWDGFPWPSHGWRLVKNHAKLETSPLLTGLALWSFASPQTSFLRCLAVDSTFTNHWTGFCVGRTSNEGACFASPPELRWLSSQCHNWWQASPVSGQVIMTLATCLYLEGWLCLVAGGATWRQGSLKFGWRGMTWGC